MSRHQAKIAQLFGPPPLHYVAMLSVHTSPLEQPGNRDAGGMNVYVRELAHQLAQRGIAVDLFTRRQHPDQPVVLHIEPGVRLFHVEAGPPMPLPKEQLFCYLPEFVTNLVFLAGQGGMLPYELIHAHYWLSGWAGFLLRFYQPIPLVQMFHTLGELKWPGEAAFQREPAIRLQVERRLLSLADGIVAANSDERAAMVETLAADPERICTVPPGVDLERFRPFPQRAAREALGLPDGPIGLYVGRIDPIKGIDTLLVAWRWLLDRWPLDSPKPLLVFIGGQRQDTPAGPQYDADLAGVVQHADALGISAFVRFLGSQPRDILPLYYSAADLCVVPSRYESFGLVAVEAMACGTPVIATHVGGLRFTVEHEISGLVVPPDNSEELAAALLRGFRDHQLRTRLQVGARQAAVRYSWDGVTNEILTFYERILSKREGTICSTPS